MDDAAVLERGAARFLVRPRVMLPRATRFADVQRLFVVLSPSGRGALRRLVIGRKRMPDPARRDRQWAYVDRVGGTMGDVLEDMGPESYDTKTEGFRVQAGAQEIARAAYAIRRHEDHVHLDFDLEDAPLVEDLGLTEHTSTIAAVFNPERWRTGEGPSEPSIYPDELQRKFADKRFAPLEPDFLDHVGCEIVLIGHEARMDDAHGDRSEEAARLRPGRRGAGA